MRDGCPDATRTSAYDGYFCLSQFKPLFHCRRPRLSDRRDQRPFVRGGVFAQLILQKYGAYNVYSSTLPLPINVLAKTSRAPLYVSRGRAEGHNLKIVDG